MPGLDQKASTRLVSISPRITVTVIGSGAPSRVTVTRTGLPRGPRNTKATPAESCLVTSSVHRDDHVAAAQVGAPCRRTGEGLHGDHLGAVHANQHADAEILRALLALHVLVFGGVEEVGMRIERAQHARNRALVDRLLRGD